MIDHAPGDRLAVGEHLFDEVEDLGVHAQRRLAEERLAREVGPLHVVFLRQLVLLPAARQDGEHALGGLLGAPVSFAVKQIEGGPLLQGR